MLEGLGWTFVLVLIVVAFWIRKLIKVSDARNSHYVELLERINHDTSQILLRIDNGHLACRAERTRLFDRE